MQTIEQLRRAGFKVKVIHSRYELPRFYGEKPRLVPMREFGDTSCIMAKGGLTRIELRSPNGVEVVGEAHCSKVDTFNRKKGVLISLGRSLANLNLK